MLLAGACARKLIRGKGWERHDFYLGVEFCLAALSAGLANLSAIAARASDASVDTGLALSLMAFFIATCFLLLLIVMSIHQDWAERGGRNRLTEIAWLGLISNVIGLGLLAAFVFLCRQV